MLDFNVIRDFLSRVDIDSSDFTVKDNMTKDYMEAFCPDMDFRQVFNTIYKFRPYYASMVDNGKDFIEVSQEKYIGEYLVTLSFLVTTDEFNSGTVIKVLVKKVTAVVDGDLKVFLGFTALDDYIEKFVV